MCNRINNKNENVKSSLIFLDIYHADHINYACGTLPKTILKTTRCGFSDISVGSHQS